MSEISVALNSFSGKFIKISQVWLRECIDFYKQQGDTGVNYSQEDLEKFVYMQWLLFDIRQVDVPVLPANINDEQKYELKQTITLQLLSVVDISRSKYSQIQKIRYKLEKPLESDANEIIEFKGDSKRCLQLNLTDGVQEIQAFEYKPMNNLSFALKPGMKIRFIAPLIVRYGQIMLQNESNILLLGGEIEELLISNAPENVLAAALNLPLNNNPVFIDNNQQPNVTLRNNLKVKNNTMHDYLIKEVVVKPVINKIKTDVDEDDFDMLLENELYGNENNKPLIPVNGNKNKVDKPKPAESILFKQPLEEDIDYMLDMEDEIKREQSLSATKIVSINNVVIASHRKSKVKNSNLDVSFGIDTDLNTKMCSLAKKTAENNTKDIADVMKKYEPFKTSPRIIEILSSPDESPKKKQKQNIANSIASTSRRQIFEESTKSPPKVQIKCMPLKTLSTTPITTGKFKVNAKFKKVIEKLRLKEEKWCIKLQIEDSSGSLDLAVDSELIEKLMGYTRQELKVYAQKGAREFIDTLATFKANMQSLDGILEIAFANKIPRLLNIL